MEINRAVFNTFPILQSTRLTLRDIRPSDAQQIFEMRSNGRVNQFIARREMETLSDAQLLIDKTIKAYQSQQAIGWAGILRDNQEIIGTCGFNYIDFFNLRAEIGGELSVDYWGKNLALDAVATIVAFGLKTMNLHTIEAKVSPNNRGAIYLMEKIGFQKEAHYQDRIYFDGKFSDMAVYSLVRGKENFSLDG